MTMETLLDIVVCLLTITCANSIYVRKLEGRVYLPMVPTSSCGGSCPIPTPSKTEVTLWRQKLMMKHSWRDNTPYSFTHVEQTENGRWQFDREFNGSQTSCNKYPDGTYSCSIEPGNYCYVHVRLGFRTRQNSEVSVHTDFANIPPHVYNGPGTVQIYGMGTDLGPTSAVTFRLRCSGRSRCLEDNATVISLQYRCTDRHFSY